MGPSCLPERNTGTYCFIGIADFLQQFEVRTEGRRRREAGGAKKGGRVFFSHYAELPASQLLL